MVPIAVKVTQGFNILTGSVLTILHYFWLSTMLQAPWRCFCLITHSAMTQGTHYRVITHRTQRHFVRSGFAGSECACPGHSGHVWNILDMRFLYLQFCCARNAFACVILKLKN